MLSSEWDDEHYIQIMDITLNIHLSLNNENTFEALAYMGEDTLYDV